MKVRLYYFLSIFTVSLLLSNTNNILPSLKSSNSTSRSNSVHIVAFRVDFQLDDDPSTTGDGTFLNQSSEEYISYYDSNVSKCSEFLIDPPPHDKDFFEDISLVGSEKTFYYFIRVNNNYGDTIESNIVEGDTTL